MVEGTMEGRVYLRESGVNELAVVFHSNRLSYVGQDCQRIPPMLHMLYGPQVHCLDLSFNALESLWGLAEFPNLEELVLDNNLLNDTIQFPRLNKLNTLSLNKNKIMNLDLLLTKVANHLPKITYLSLLGNIACPNQLSDSEKDEEDYRRYRSQTLAMDPELWTYKARKCFKLGRPFMDYHLIHGFCMDQMKLRRELADGMSQVPWDDADNAFPVLIEAMHWVADTLGLIIMVKDHSVVKYYVLHHLPGLQFLDSSRVSFEEHLEAERRGHFMKVVRPSNTVMPLSSDEEDPMDRTPYTPLPSSRRGAGDHKGAYGKCRYRYSGKHSEGNRFIANSDL